MFVVPKNHRPKIDDARKNFLAKTGPWVESALTKVISDIDTRKNAALKKMPVSFYDAEAAVFRLFQKEKVNGQPNPFYYKKIQAVPYNEMEHLWTEFLKTSELCALLAVFGSRTFIRNIDGIDCFITSKEFTDAYKDKSGDFYYDAYSEFLKNLTKAFPYEKMDNKDAAYNGYVLCKELDMNVCIYCNANLTLTVTDENTSSSAAGISTRKGASAKTRKEARIVRPALDHYMAKARFPILRLTFDNLIPACNMCNSGMKKERIMLPSRYLHPYQDKLPGITFVYGPDADSVRVHSGKTSAADELGQRSEASLDFFRTDLVYDYFGQEARKIREKEEIYTPEYLEDILKIIGDKKSPHFQSLQILAGNGDGEPNPEREQFLKALFGYVEEEDAMHISLGDMKHDLTKRILEKF